MHSHTRVKRQRGERTSSQSWRLGLRSHLMFPQCLLCPDQKNHQYTSGGFSQPVNPTHILRIDVLGGQHAGVPKDLRSCKNIPLHLYQARHNPALCLAFLFPGSQWDFQMLWCWNHWERPLRLCKVSISQTFLAGMTATQDQVLGL